MAEFVAENLRRNFGDAIERVSDDRGDLTVWVIWAAPAACSVIAFRKWTAMPDVL